MHFFRRKEGPEETEARVRLKALGYNLSTEIRGDAVSYKILRCGSTVVRRLTLRRVVEWVTKAEAEARWKKRRAG